MHSFVLKRSTILFALAATSLVAGCKDKRIKAVDSGITRDSLLSVIGKGAPGADSMPNVYRTERYLIGGKNYEIFFFSRTGQHLYGAVKDTLPYKELTPIAMIDKRVVGKDWEFLDSLYGANKIPLHKRE